MQGIQNAAAVDAGVEVALSRPNGHTHHHHAAKPDGDGGRLRIGHAGVEPTCRIRAGRIPAHPFGYGAPADLLFSLDEHPNVHGKLTSAGHGTGHMQQRQEVALVVAGAPAVEPAVTQSWLEGWRVPQLSRAGPLNVVVAVDEDGWGVRSARPQLAHGQRVGIAEADQLALAAGLADT